MKELIEKIEAEIKYAESSAEECFQDRDNPQEGDRYLAKAEAWKQVIIWINETIK